MKNDNAKSHRRILGNLKLSEVKSTISGAVDAAKPAAREFAETAGPKARHMVEVAKPKARQVVDAAKPLAGSAIQYAKPLIPIATNLISGKHPVAAMAADVALNTIADTASKNAAAQEPAEVTVEAVETVPAEGDYAKQVEAVRRFKQLLDEGIITQAEFEAKKREVMGL